ncbi:hypothetical protein TSACC_21750 [Terrimicrobium sacchariphilum]|uniref:Uncharacterized protein n=1 Tax=Terrimicrobium sacchariphilum TaxID=690879 RepID=A0A146G6H2_TERSA|nr:hypothetical protein [Terrimicrobium sacchariphilum]GAT33335.1 hypothetical protein TSACC_21750 [Terrimicrobium sacchariphilum]
MKTYPFYLPGRFAIKMNDNKARLDQRLRKLLAGGVSFPTSSIIRNRGNRLKVSFRLP